MEASQSNSDAYRGSAVNRSINDFTRHGLLSASNLIQAPLSTLLEYSGLLPTSVSSVRVFQDQIRSRLAGSSATANEGEVSIIIIGVGEQHNDREVSELVAGQVRESSAQSELYMQPIAGPGSAGVVLDGQIDPRSERGAGEGISQPNNNSGFDREAAEGGGANGRDPSFQRYNIQQAARWMEQILPFSLLLLVVFIRQHLQGVFVTTWIAAVMLKLNDVLRKQTALKGDRKISILLGISLAVMLHVVGVYWWFMNVDLLHPLVMLPPKSIPPFWHAIFIIMVNDTLVRLAAMLLKCLLLIYYKNSRRQNYCKQGQMLTLVEYLVLLYRALLPTPVWYRFLLNKEYGSLFSSLMTGLYLTFKLTSVIEKVQSFFSALKTLSRKEIHFGAHATSEQVNEIGDLCAICQEKMHAPIVLRCKHIFCEECVSEWFEKEQTCPLCRTQVKQADIRSFADGSTSLYFQIF